MSYAVFKTVVFHFMFGNLYVHDLTTGYIQKEPFGKGYYCVVSNGKEEALVYSIGGSCVGEDDEGWYTVASCTWEGCEKF